jgi:hypothetical protein
MQLHDEAVSSWTGHALEDSIIDMGSWKYSFIFTQYNQEVQFLVELINILNRWPVETVARIYLSYKNILASSSIFVRAPISNAVSR